MCCSECYLGIVSAGDVSGPGSSERSIITGILNSTSSRPLTPVWDNNCSSPVAGPLVLTCPDGRKQLAVREILNWYSNRSVTIPDSSVYMFDDRESNIKPFSGTRFNARQVSCGSRDTSPFDNSTEPSEHGAVGFCGGSVHEVVANQGVQLCR